MAAAKKSENVPKAMQEQFNKIVAITDDFCQQHLNDEYAQLIRYAAAALCRKRPSPLNSGQAKSWACGITHAIGLINFLHDPAQTPHMKTSELYKAFGVSSSTGQAKSKIVRDALDTFQLDPNWCLSTHLANHPLALLLNRAVSTMQEAPPDGQLTALPPELQALMSLVSEVEVVPSNQRSKKKAKTPKKSQQKTEPTIPNALYTLLVSLFDGPVTEAFIAKNPVIARTIEIQGRHTLADLHRIIFKAYDREEEHMYEFQFGGDRPNDPQAERYVLAAATQFGMDEEPAGLVSETKLDDLNLAVDDVFGYWFDFGDDWWHQIVVGEIVDKDTQKKRSPKIVAREGKSPPQYPDFDDW